MTTRWVWRPTRYADGTVAAALMCDICGYNFDPLVYLWVCPHCHARWPILPPVLRPAAHRKAA